MSPLSSGSWRAKLRADVGEMEYGMHAISSPCNVASSGVKGSVRNFSRFGALRERRQIGSNGNPATTLVNSSQPR